MFLTHARIALPDPASVVTPLCAHLVEHEAVVETGPGEARIALAGATATLRYDDAQLEVAVEAAELAALASLRFAVASHVVEFAPEGKRLRIHWEGDGAGPSLLPGFRLLTVAAIETVTPHMRRIHFAGEDLARYDSLEALHVRLFIPPAGLAEPAWPMLGEDGLPIAPPEDKRPAIRKYTIRSIDAAAGRLAIDFVLHDDAGPGAAFAARAQPGDQVGMAGPGGRGLQSAGRYVFLADATGLPAVGRMLAALPAQATGLAIVEVAGPEEEQALARPEGVTLRWLHRADGAPSGLAEAFDALDWPADGPDSYLWAAMEHADFLRIRAGARERLRRDRDRHLVVSYWRAGLAEEQHAADKKAAAAKAA
ncbi:siderophore-interacting protein [Bosea sp. (in: a-proteobacteria)]|uniref:siderophore-interacting protein n=1 Tax=Bosea sp. (in: a-proteobacteria) TaxID=1871050 RepID=UPI00333E5C12